MELPTDTDVIFVPARPVQDATGRVPAIELRRLAESGERVALAFSSVSALARTLGPDQPWLGLPMYPYVAWLRMNGVNQIQIDPSGVLR